jgi:hypothetical protein
MPGKDSSQVPPVNFPTVEKLMGSLAPPCPAGLQR